AIRERFPGRAHVASWRVDEAIEQALAAVAGEVPVVVFIDDAPSVDAATLGWLVGLATRVRQARVLVLLTARTDQSTAVAPLAQLRGAHGVERVRLHALQAPEIERLLASMLELLPSERHDLDPALDEVVARRFLRVTLQAPGRYEFSHELARHATYNLLPVARRRALHRAAVQALRERGGRDALTRAAVRYHRGRAESVALQAGRWAKRHAVGVAFGSVGALIAAAVFIQHTRRTPALDPDLVAVAPFDVLDRKFALWHEGLVDYLSRNLDGAGSIRTVSPTIVLRGWNGPADPASATELGRRSGARWVVFG